jgi:hypothetical protein
MDFILILFCVIIVGLMLLFVARRFTDMKIARNATEFFSAILLLLIGILFWPITAICEIGRLLFGSVCD